MGLFGLAAALLARPVPAHADASGCTVPFHDGWACYEIDSHLWGTSSEFIDGSQSTRQSCNNDICDYDSYWRIDAPTDVYYGAPYHAGCSARAWFNWNPDDVVYGAFQFNAYWKDDLTYNNWRRFGHGSIG